MKSGIVYNMISRVLFILGAYVLHVGLARLLGPREYGVFGVVLSVLMICYIFLNNGVRQAVARLAASHPESSGTILYHGLKYQIAIGLILAAALIVFNPLLVRFLGDRMVRAPLYIAAGIVATQGIYFVFAGVLNGQRRFLSESIVLSTYAVARPLAAISVAWLGRNAGGAVAGLLTASVVSILVGGYLCRGGPRAPIDTSRLKLLDIAWPTMLAFGFISLVMNLGMIVLKHYSGGNAEVVGFYTAASAMASFPYWVLFAFGNVGMPIISHGFGRGENGFVRDTIRQLTAHVFILVAPATVILAAVGGELVKAMFTAKFAAAASPFFILIFGIFFLGVASIFAHCLVAVGRERAMLVWTLTAGALCIALNVVLVPNYLMLGAAAATGIASLVMAAGLAVALGLATGPFVRLRSAAKWAVVLAGVWLIAVQIKGGLPALIAGSALLYLAAVGALSLWGELHPGKLIAELRARKLNQT